MKKSIPIGTLIIPILAVLALNLFDKSFYQAVAQDFNAKEINSGSGPEKKGGQPLADRHLKINEIMASNPSAWADPDFKQFSDWIEIFNSGTSVINLAGYTLTDNLDQEDKWVFPAGTLIPPGGFLVVSADSRNTGLHTNFELSSGGEEVGLFGPNGEFIDTLRYDALASNISYGRLTGGTPAKGFFWQPTPGAENSGGISQMVFAQPVKFSKNSGFYPVQQTIELSCSDPLAVIRYTLDGTDPKPASTRYTSPVTVGSNVVIKARSFRDGFLPGEVATNTFLINENIGIPVVSIGIHPKFLKEPEYGIYRDDNLAERREWERPATLEFFEPGGQTGFNANVDLRLFGRSAVRLPQKSLAVFVRPKNGIDGLDYPLFKDSPVTFYQSFVLRSSSDDWRNTLFRDGMIESLIKGQIDIVNQNYRPSIVFINGAFMGIHNIRDKINPNYFATQRGVDPENLDLIYVDNDYYPPKIEVESGDAGSFQAMWEFVIRNDMSAERNYLIASGLLDLDSFIDFCAIQILTANQSWRHNFKLWRAKDAGTPFRCVVWDLDYGYQFIEKNNLADMAANEPLLRSLVKNPGFKIKFQARLESLSQTVFSSERSLYFIDSMARVIEPYIPRHTDKWKGTLSGVIENKAEWEQRVEVMRSFARNRPSVQDGYFKAFFGATAKSGIRLSVIPAEAGKMFSNGKFLTEKGFSGEMLRNNVLNLNVVPNPGNIFLGWQGNSAGSVNLIPFNSEWRYLDNGTNPGNSWFSAGFQDNSWKKGIGFFGYGEPGAATTLGFGTDQNHRHITYYFRKTFPVTNPGQYKTVSASFTVNDGAVFYLNGQEVYRYNMPDGSVGPVTTATKSLSGTARSEIISFALEPGLLLAGSNIFAAEVHQSAANSPDLRFDLALSAHTGNLDNSESLSISAGQNQQIEARFRALRESPLVITEIHYAPSSAQGADEEFIEVFNAGSIPLNISGLYFDGITFAFPAGSRLESGEFAIVAKNKQPYVKLPCQVFQWAQGSLADAGQLIAVYNGQKQVLDQVVYSPAAPWPAGIAGSGYSIELKDPHSDNSAGSNWRKSGFAEGSPGALNPVSVYKNLVINEIVGVPGDHGYWGGSDWIEIYNSGSESFDMAGLYLSDDPVNPARYRIPSGFPALTTISPGGFLVFIANDDSLIGPTHLPFKISGESGTIILSALAYNKTIIIDQADYQHLARGGSTGRYPSGTGNLVHMKTPTPGKLNRMVDLNIIAPARIRSGDRVPLAVRITSETGETDKTVNGTFNLILTSGSITPSMISVRNGMGSVTVTIVAGTDVEVSISGYPYKRRIEISDGIPEILLKGPITQPTILASGTDYLIKSDLIITDTANLIVRPGARLKIDKNIRIKSSGRIEMRGTEAEPVVLMPANGVASWGGIEIQNVDSVSRFEWLLECLGGGDTLRGRGHTFSQPVIYGNHTKIALNQVFMTDNPGKVLYADYSAVTIENSLFARCKMGPEIRFSHGEYRNSWFMEFPDADWSNIDDDNDAVYFWNYSDPDKPHILENCVINKVEDDGVDILTAPVFVRNCLIANVYDKGISAGYRSRAEVHRSVFAFNGMGISPSFYSDCKVDQSTFYKSGRALFGYEAGGVATNCIFSDHSTSYTSDSTMSFWFFDHCISNRDRNLKGAENLFGAPGLVNPEKWDFTLTADAVSIDKGKPGYPTDPDGSIPDLGAFPFLSGGVKNLIFNEIYYNPPDFQGLDEYYEYIELYNPGSRVLDLTGWKIDGGLGFDFPDGTIVSPGEFILICSDRITYRSLDCKVFSWASGKLSNSSDRLQLVNRDGSVVDEVTYTDSPPWPTLADGQGYSLALKDPALDNSVATSWMASYVFGGTPGSRNTQPDFTKLKINELFVDNTASDSWIEIYNGDINPVNLTGLAWSDDDASPAKWIIPLVSKEDLWLEPFSYRVFFFSGTGSGSTDSIGFLPDPSRGRISLNRMFDGQYALLDRIVYTDMDGSGSLGRYPNGSGGFREFRNTSPAGPNVLGARHFVAMRQIKDGERLPVVVKLDSVQDIVPDQVTGPMLLAADHADLNANQVSLVKGRGSLTMGLTSQRSHFQLSLPEYNDTLGIDILAERVLALRDGLQEFSQTWTAGQDYYIPDKIEIPVGRTLAILPGTRILLGEKAGITVYGKLEVLGTLENPVVFMSRDWDKPWGGIEFGPDASEASVNNCFFINGGADSDKATGHSGSQALLSTLGGPVSITNGYFIDNKGKAIFSSGAKVVVINSMISRCDGGIEVYNGRIELDGSAILFLPNESQIPAGNKQHDGVFLSGKKTGYPEAALISSSLIGYTTDDGIEAAGRSGLVISRSIIYKAGGQGISITDNRTSGDHLLVESCKEGIVTFEAGYGYIDHSTFYRNQIALRSATMNSAIGHGHLFLTNSIISGSIVNDVLIEDGNELILAYSLSDKILHSGTGNRQGEPQLVSPATGNFNLNPGSPAIDGGDPGYPPDPDGTRSDMGAYWYNQSVKGKLIINEIHYKPMAGQMATEFIELVNFSADTFDISGYSFETGIVFIFPAGAIIEPGEYLVIAKNKATLSGRGFRVYQWTAGDLSDQGETITLLDAENNPVDKVSYRNDQGWSFWPDGLGPSLELADPSLDNSLPRSWRSSFYLNGTPGMPNNPAPVENVYINEVLARNATTYPDETGQFSDWIEFYNGSGHFIDLAGLYLTKSQDNPGMFRIPEIISDSTLIAPDGFLVFWLDESPGKGIRHAGFLIPGAGSFIGLAAKELNQFRYLDSLSYTDLAGDVSYGRLPDGGSELVKMTVTTPGRSNGGPGTPEETENPNVRIFPNPSTDVVHIELIPIENNYLSVEIMDMFGKVYKKWDLTGFSQSDLINLTWPTSHKSLVRNGLYVVIIKTDYQVFSRKLIVNH